MTEALRDLSFVDHIDPVDPNSSLAMHGDYKWGINDSPFSDYARVTFTNFPNGLTGIMYDRLRRSQQNVGLDLAGGSTGRAMRDILQDRWLDRALVTNYEDNMPPVLLEQCGGRLHHIAGHLGHRSTWSDIANWQQEYAPEGFAMITHRPFGALQYEEIEAYRGGAHFLLDSLRTGGFLYTQVPEALLGSKTEHIRLLREIERRPDVEAVFHGVTQDWLSGHHYALITKQKM